MENKRVGILQKVADGELTPEQADKQLLNLSDVSGSLANWKSFRAGFVAARDCWNAKYATEPDSVKWTLLPDKIIANAWWKWFEGNNR